MEGDQPGGVKQCVKHLQGERVGLEEVSLPKELCSRGCALVRMGLEATVVPARFFWPRCTVTEQLWLIH